MNKGLAIVTGADGGMGVIHTTALAKAGYEVVMACIDATTATPAYERIKAETGGNIRLMEVHLDNLQSVVAFADEIKKQYASLSILLNNAGVLCQHAQSSDNGIDYTIAVNYLGAYTLTNLLLPIMGRGTRVVSMISLSYRFGKITPNFFDPQTEAHFNRFSAYANSKLALYYFTVASAKKYQVRGISFYCADPGIVNTGIISLGITVIDKLCDWFFRPFIHTREQGAASMLAAALSPEFEGLSGIIVKNKKLKKPIRRFVRNTKQPQLLEELTRQVLEKNHIDL